MGPRKYRGRRFAYVWYATRPTYLCNAVMGFKKLKSLTTLKLRRDVEPVKVWNATHDDSEIHKSPSVAVETMIDTKTMIDTIDFVLIYSNGLDESLLTEWEAMGGQIRKVEPLHLNWSFAFYKDCEIKLHVFHLFEYDRVVFLDSDAVVYASLDKLFMDAIPYTTRLAAIPYYWGDQYRASSALFVVTKPSEVMYQRALQLSKKPKNVEDLPLLNDLMKEYSSQLLSFGDKYFVLDSEWHVTDNVYRYTGRNSRPEDFSVVHFSAFGKPWYYGRDQADIYLQQGLVTSEFVGIWRQWWKEIDEVCPGLYGSRGGEQPFTSVSWWRDFMDNPLLWFIFAVFVATLSLFCFRRYRIRQRRRSSKDLNNNQNPTGHGSLRGEHRGLILSSVTEWNNNSSWITHP